MSQAKPTRGAQLFLSRGNPCCTPSASCAAKIKESREVQIKARTDINKTNITAKFESMRAVNPIQVVGEFITLLRAVHWRERIRAKESGADNLNSSAGNG